MREHFITLLPFIPESYWSFNVPFFFISANNIVDANELEGEKGGVIVETLDSGETLQSVTVLEAVKQMMINRT